MGKILIVEDDSKLNNGISLALANENDQFIQCRNLKEAKRALADQEVDLILLDVNLPDGNGLDLLKEIRKKSEVPIIMLTANDMETDIVTGLELGADDYITKPFSLMVLRARVSVQLRKRANLVSDGIFKIDDFVFDFTKMQFFVKEALIDLSKTEQRLLRFLLENKGISLSRSQIIDYVWSGDSEYVDEHALTVTVNRLRTKLGEDKAAPNYIKTIYGIGYMWAVK